MNYKIMENENGQGLVEYALILVLVSIAVIVTMSLMGNSIKLANAQAMAGLSNRSFDNQVIITEQEGVEQRAQTGRSRCITRASTTRFMVVDENGRLLNDDTVTVYLTANGGTNVRSYNATRISRGEYEAATTRWLIGPLPCGSTSIQASITNGNFE